jgi:hypothetical protein
MSKYKKGWNLISNAKPHKSRRATKMEIEWVKQKTHRLHDDTRKIFVHVLISTLQELKKTKDGDELIFVPVGCKFLHENFSKGNWRTLVQRGLLLLEPFDREQKKSNRFAIPRHLLDDFISLTDLMPLAVWRRTAKYNLMTGKESQVQSKNRIYDKHGNKEIDLVVDAMTTISENRREVNIEAMEHIVNWRLWVRESCREKYGDKSKQFKKANHQYINDQSCLRAVDSMSQFIFGKPGFKSYKPTFKLVGSRIYENGGGLQSGSSELKEAAKTGVKDFNNYDLRSSQVTFLIENLRIAGIDATPFIDYASDEKAKDKYAALVGCSPKCWKRSLLTLIMGGYKPGEIDPDASEDNFSANSIETYFLEDFSFDTAKAQEAINRFLEVVKPFASRLAEWHRWLLEHYFPAERRKSPKGWYIKNRLGAVLYPREPKDKHKRQGIKRLSPAVITSRIAAHLLQGAEALFIHTLTLLGAKYGFKVVGNEHDGICVMGTIPDEAVKEAAEMCGLSHLNLALVPKDFVEDWAAKKAEIDEFLSYRKYLTTDELIDKAA